MNKDLRSDRDGYNMAIAITVIAKVAEKHLALEERKLNLKVHKFNVDNLNNKFEK